MKIKSVKIWSEDLKLSRPYTISYETIDSVENVFVHIQLEDGTWGIGAGSPAEFVTGENILSCVNALENHSEELLIDKNINSIDEICESINNRLSSTPAARAALDIALFDAHSKFHNISLIDFFGKCHNGLFTSVTMGIKSIKESADEAKEYVSNGFRFLKIKTGSDVDHDIELMHKVRETVGNSISIRVDANQGYSIEDLNKFVNKTKEKNIELIEQPFPRDHDSNMHKISESVSDICAADESLHDPEDAIRLTNNKKFFGIFNIKLMKCGGLYPARKIAHIANQNNIDLMWGCMDESIVSISAALHIALSSTKTKYLDLDGSFDLARDIVSGGFMLKEGKLIPTMEPGLGVNYIDGINI